MLTFLRAGGGGETEGEKVEEKGEEKKERMRENHGMEGVEGRT